MEPFLIGNDIEVQDKVYMIFVPSEIHVEDAIHTMPPIV